MHLGTFWMTLAALFLFTLMTRPATGMAPAQPSATQSAPASDAADQQSPAAETEPGTQPAAQTPSTPKSPQSQSSSAKRRRKKKVAQTECSDSASGAGSATAAKKDSETTGSTPGSQAQASGTNAATNCPPPKIIVRKGGTSDPSIQLAGGAITEESTQKRDAVNQLLGATDENLKKTAALQMSADQQNTIAQTRQFVEQSKAALRAGDLERARTLAWKAELLSEDLIKPQK